MNREQLKKEKSRWLRMEDNSGWQIIIPETDIKPHGFPNGKNTAELEYANCPCKPKVDIINQIISHNSFEEMEKVDKAVSKIYG